MPRAVAKTPQETVGDDPLQDGRRVRVPRSEGLFACVKIPPVCVKFTQLNDEDLYAGVMQWLAPFAQFH
jgi:hypothetical protein